MALPAAVGLGLAGRTVLNRISRGQERSVAGHGKVERRGELGEAGVRSSEASLIAGRSIREVWCFALAIVSIVAAVDAMLGHRVILIWLLIAGPCCGLLTGRWARTATVGGWAVALGVLLGLPDGIWGTWTHVAFLGPVVIVTLVSIACAALIERLRGMARLP